MSVPVLRFKDEAGQDFREWLVKPISELAIKVIDGDRGQNYPNGNDFSNEGYCLFLNAKNVTKSGFSFEELSFLTKEKDEQLRKGKLSKNDLILTTRGSVGNVAHFDNEVKYVNMRINSGMVILRSESTGISPNYLYQYFYSPIFTKSVQQIAFGSAQPQLTVLEIKKFIVGLPSLSEQTKIANFLTAIDEKITQLTQKYDLLTQYKKGVMQQIFSQELRFKDDNGVDFPEWEEKTMGEIYTFIQTNSFSRELLSYETGTIKNIHYGDIHTKFKSNFKIENENVPFIKPNVDLNKISMDCYCKERDLVIADASEDYADVGKAIEIISLGSQKLLSGLHTYIARDLSEQMSLGFSGYLMQTENVRLQIKTLATGVSVLGISKGNLTKVMLKIPTKPEQAKIANFLTAIDDKITTTQTQLQAVKQYKQGLLQQMFA